MGRLVHLAQTVLLILSMASSVTRGAEPAPPRQKVTLQLKWHHQFQFAGYYAALSQGYYAQEGLAVTIVEGNAEQWPIRTVLAGKADFGVSDADVLLAYLHGQPLVALGAIFQHSPHILLMRADSGIRTPSDLRGRTVMLENEQGTVQVQAMFRREGIPFGSLHLVPHTGNIQNLIDGQVAAMSAYSTVEPHQLRARGIEPSIIRAVDYGIDFYGDTLFTTRDLAQRHPERVAAFRRASFKGWDYAMAHPEEMIEQILQMPGVRERGITRDLLRHEATAMRELVLPDLVDIGHMNPGRWEAIARAYADVGFIPRAPDSIAPFLFDPHAHQKVPRWLLPVLVALGAAALGGIWVLLWNLQLKRMVERRTVELRRSEEQMKAAKLSAEDASRAKDHFLAVLSHELRTPLTPVVASLSMLKHDLRLDAETRETLEMIRRNVDLEARLIDDLLDITRIARGKIELDRRPVALSAIIVHAVEVCRPDIEARQLHFGMDLGPAASCLINADATRLQQVFWNLLKNAIKFTPHGGCVGIRCGIDDHARVWAEVTDSGAGIEPEALGRIFDAFEQAERSITRQFGGLGLGLAISKALVEMHGGTIEAQSDGKGKGATFRVTLPVVAPSQAPPAEQGQNGTAGVPASQANSRQARHLRILLVEDHGDTARIMKRLLMAEGHEVQTAGDVATALNLAVNQTFDLLISDLGLPDGSGLDLVRNLRQRGTELPAIALSGYGQEEDVQRSKEAGFTLHLTKPVEFQRLQQAMEQMAVARRRTGPDPVDDRPVSSI